MEPIDHCAETTHRSKVTPSKTSTPLCRQNHVSTVMLHGVPIVFLTIDNKERLCLAQISSTLLKNYSYNEIHNRRVALGITCVQCTPVQLEILRRAGAMPVSSRRCGMISKREAERLVKSFLEETNPPKLPEDFAFDVVHECGWGCRGQFMPSRYNSSRAKCIKCSFCHAFQSPNKFIFHHHRTPESKYSHPDAANFNSWRRHLKLVSGHQNKDLVYAWEDVKAMFNGGSRKRLMNNASLEGSRNQARLLCGSVSSQRKKMKMDEMPIKNNREMIQKSDFPAYCVYPTLGKPMTILPATMQQNALTPTLYQERTQGFTMLNTNSMPFGYNPAMKSPMLNPYPHLRIKYPGFFQFFGNTSVNKQPFVDQSMYAAVGSRLNPYFDHIPNRIEELETKSPEHSPNPEQHDINHNQMCVQERDAFWSSAFKPVTLPKISPTSFDTKNRSTPRLTDTPTHTYYPENDTTIKRISGTATKKVKHSDFSVESLINNTYKSTEEPNGDHIKAAVKTSQSPDVSECLPMNLQISRNNGFGLTTAVDQDVVSR